MAFRKGRAIYTSERWFCTTRVGFNKTTIHTGKIPSATNIYISTARITLTYFRIFTYVFMEYPSADTFNSNFLFLISHLLFQ